MTDVFFLHGVFATSQIALSLHCPVLEIRGENLHLENQNPKKTPEPRLERCTVPSKQIYSRQLRKGQVSVRAHHILAKLSVAPMQTRSWRLWPTIAQEDDQESNVSACAP